MPGTTPSAVITATTLNALMPATLKGIAYLTGAMAMGTGSCEWSPYSTGVEWSPVMQTVKDPLPSDSACHRRFTSCPTIASTTSKYPTYARAHPQYRLH